MLRVLSSIAILWSLMLALPVSAQVVPINELSTDELSEETQQVPPNTPDDYYALTWWLPYEWWATLMEEDSEEMLAQLKPYTVIAMVEADIGPLGSFTYYSERDVAKTLAVSFVDPDGNRTPLEIVDDVPSDLALLIAMMKPVISAAMGNMGESLHFFVLDDQTSMGSRIADPYGNGSLEVSFVDHKDRSWSTQTPFPLNSLFIPRMCPNGKPAHVSWSYCPWTGTKLPELER